ncbi:MAG: aminotransferase, partial [Microbacteriaceae bacterium]|nr:aminotransferase [Microbacteriaceae bacterium]
VFGIPTGPARPPTQRAGIRALDPPADRLTTLTASLYNHGVTATTRAGRVRLSAHVTTSAETFAMLRAAFLSLRST